MNKFTTLDDVLRDLKDQLPFMVAYPPIHVWRMNGVTRLHIEHLYREHQIEKAKLTVVEQIGFVPDTVPPLRFEELGYIYGFPIETDDTMADDVIELSTRVDEHKGGAE